jgi:hypothetical protein
MSSNLWNNPIMEGEEELTNKIEQILASSGAGLYVRPGDGRIAFRFEGMTSQTPWIHISHGTRRECGLWNHIYTKQFKIIPKGCRNGCWKTVIKPPNVVGLFQLEGLMQALGLPSKCGIDIRNYTPGAYAGFVYGDSIADGREYYQRFKAALEEMGAGDWPIILKRACTEQEMIIPSDQWDTYMTPEKRLIEKKLDDIFAHDQGDGGGQSDWIKNVIRRRWLRHALAIGDQTWRELMDEVPEGFFPHTVQYQDWETFQKTKSKKLTELPPAFLMLVKGGNLTEEDVKEDEENGNNENNVSGDQASSETSETDAPDSSNSS